MKIAIITLFTLLSSTAIAEARCYQLSSNGAAWSRTPEVLCVDESAEPARLTLETGTFQRKTVATFRFDLLERVRCFDCNRDVFGLANPSNSLFNDLKISFDGEGVPQEQEGTVTIGDNVFFYRSL